MARTMIGKPTLTFIFVESGASYPGKTGLNVHPAAQCREIPADMISPLHRYMNLE